MARHKIKVDVIIEAAKPMSTMYRMNNGDGLYLLVKSDGAKWGRFDYSIDGERKTLSVGVYPNTLLGAARKKANDARELVAVGTDPSDIRKTCQASKDKTPARPGAQCLLGTHCRKFAVCSVRPQTTGAR